MDGPLDPRLCAQVRAVLADLDGPAGRAAAVRLTDRLARAGTPADVAAVVADAIDVCVAVGGDTAGRLAGELRLTAALLLAPTTAPPGGRCTVAAMPSPTPVLDVDFSSRAAACADYYFGTDMTGVELGDLLEGSSAMFLFEQLSKIASSLVGWFWAPDPDGPSALGPLAVHLTRLFFDESADTADRGVALVLDLATRGFDADADEMATIADIGTPAFVVAVAAAAVGLSTLAAVGERASGGDACGGDAIRALLDPDAEPGTYTVTL